MPGRGPSGPNSSSILAWRKQSRQEGYEEPVEDGMEESSNRNTTVPPLKQGHGGSLNAGRLGINDALGY